MLDFPKGTKMFMNESFVHFFVVCGINVKAKGDGLIKCFLYIIVQSK